MGKRGPKPQTTKIRAGRPTGPAKVGARKSRFSHVWVIVLVSAFGLKRRKAAMIAASLRKNGSYINIADGRLKVLYTQNTTHQKPEEFAQTIYRNQNKVIPSRIFEQWQRDSAKLLGQALISKDLEQVAMARLSLIALGWDVEGSGVLFEETERETFRLHDSQNLFQRFSYWKQ